MRNLFIILLFRLKLQLRGMFRTRASSLVLSIIGLVGAIGFFVMISLGMVSLFFEIAKISKHAVVILFAYQSMIVSALLLLQVIPTVSVDLFDENSYYKYFLFLPVHRGALVLTTFLTSLAGAIFPLFLILPSAFGYLIVMHNLEAVCGVISFAVFLAGLSLFGAVVGTKLMQTSALRKLGKFAMIINVLVFVAYWQIFPHFDSKVSDISNPLMSIYIKLQHLDTGFPIFWIFSSAIEGNVITLLLVLVVGIFLWRAGWHIANTISFEAPFQLKSERNKVKKAEISKKLWKYPVLSRDILTFIRDAESYLMLIYPLFLALIFSLGSRKNFIQAISVAIVTASIYCMMSSLKLLMEDTKNSRLICTYPIDLYKTVLRRALFMAFLWTTVVIVASSVYLIVFKLIYPIYLMIVPIFLTMFANSLIAQKIWLGKAKASVSNPKNALGIQVIGYALVPTFLGILPVLSSDIANLSHSNKTIFTLIIVAFSYILSLMYVFLSKLLLRKNRILGYFQNI